MEKFEIDDEKRLEVFNNFVGKAKDALTTLIENIKTNIKKYETAIEDTTKEIADAEGSREKCEHEITKMEGNINTIKEAIDNVESTYKKIVDAYSSTSKGETKELYSEIIDGAKANCEKDVEKNKTEIARLQSDIEAIKNNIAEFTKIIEELNHDLDGYKLEVSKYSKALEYLEKVNDKASTDLDNIASKKEEPKKKVETKSTKRSVTKVSKIEEEEEPIEEVETEEQVNPLVIGGEIEEPEEIDLTSDEDNKEEEPVEKSDFELEEPEVSAPEKKTNASTNNALNFEDSLKQIYDLTGYKPKKEEEKEVKEEPKHAEPVSPNNLENLFNNNAPDIKEEPKKKDYDESDMSEWERILNGADEVLTNITPNSSAETNEPKEMTVEKTSVGSAEDTVNQLLKPYGTTFNELKSLTSKEIVHKDGSKLPFDMTVEDVIKAVNEVDGNDLKMMRTLGPNITLLRKVKKAKEGIR